MERDTQFNITYCKKVITDRIMIHFPFAKANNPINKLLFNCSIFLMCIINLEAQLRLDKINSYSFISIDCGQQIVLQ